MKMLNMKMLNMTPKMTSKSNLRPFGVLALSSSLILTTVLGTAFPEATQASDRSSSQLRPVLTPFKDSLYTNKPFDGRFRKCDAEINERTQALPSFPANHQIYEFFEERDVNGRDVPLPNGRWQNFAKPEYITPLNPGDYRRFDLTINDSRGRRQLETNEVGTLNGARFAVIFIHGAAGIYANKDLGFNDEMFSGNFNRLKNLVVQNSGVYYTPTIKDFESGGPIDVAALIQHVAEKAPGAPIVLACASAGGSVCARVAQMEGPVNSLSGLIIMGSSMSSDFLRSPAFHQKVPIVFAQGTCDRGNPYDRLYSVFSSILKQDPNYPTRFAGFADGVHGTPIRMMDWRKTLNWIFAVRR